ncbi:MAG TPA: DUF4910 domain-containing protein [Anaerolineales bacterium]|nr:DUF4910 domain-containing protein [Anaerolineales bacterium]
MDYVQRAFEHIRHLSETIGGRGSCSPNHRRAAEYSAEALRSAGVSQIEFEPFRGMASTYLPFALAFASALTGTCLALFFGNRLTFGIAALMNFLGAWAMFAESEFASNWTRWLIPTAETINVTGAVSPQTNPKRQIILCSHLDTHRTPIFYSSTAWQKAFGVSVTGAFLSMVLSALTFGLGTLLDLNEFRWVGLLFGLVQMYALTLVISAEFTPFSPGANDNASGTGIILALAERLRAEPLTNTKVNFIFTDCEETGAHGILAYLKKHAEAFGKDAVYIILDEVGAGQLKTVTEDGLIRKSKTHPRALELARNANFGLTQSLIEAKGEAYTDALPATKQGLIALPISSAFPNPEQAVSHWHQMSDRIEFIDRQSLQDTFTFTWNILQAVDHQADAETISSFDSITSA